MQQLQDARSNDSISISSLSGRPTNLYRQQASLSCLAPLINQSCERECCSDAIESICLGPQGNQRPMNMSHLASLADQSKKKIYEHLSKDRRFTTIAQCKTPINPGTLVVLSPPWHSKTPSKTPMPSYTSCEMPKRNHPLSQRTEEHIQRPRTET